MALKQWSGWAVMKEGGLPHLYGDRQTAELHCRHDQDEFLVFLQTDQERTNEYDRLSPSSVSFLTDKDTYNLIMLCEHLWRNKPPSIKDLDQLALRRLAELGVAEFYGEGRYGVTAFGYWCYQAKVGHPRVLPLKTIGDTAN